MVGLPRVESVVGEFMGEDTEFKSEDEELFKEGR
jgi:hypothetical protein